jgi:hypothetical protein
MLLHVLTPCYICFSRWFREACCLHLRVHSVSSRYKTGDSETLSKQKSPQPYSETPKMKAARSSETWELSYLYIIRCKKTEEHNLRNSEVLNVEECKLYGAHTLHSVKVHIAVLWFKTSYSLVQTFWKHITTMVSECVC